MNPTPANPAPANPAPASPAPPSSEAAPAPPAAARPSSESAGSGPAAATAGTVIARAGLAVALIAGTVLAALTSREGGILGAPDRLLAEVLGMWVTWAVALTCLLRARLPARGLVLVLLGGAAALRLAALAPVAPLSDDLYRYAWDGSVQAAGVDPYRYPPAAAGSVPGLADRRTDWLFPGAVPGGDTCADVADPQACTRINRPGVRTIYPPVAQVWFLAGHLAGASHLRDVGWELLALLPDAATGLLIWRVLRRSGRDPALVAVYAWSPLAVLEAVQNAHVDGLATLLVVLAVSLGGRRPGTAGAVLGLAAMVKLYPALLLPVLLGRRPLRVVGAFTAVCVASYLPHVLAVGGRVVGYLPGYLREEQYDAGGRYLLLRPLGLSPTVTTALVALAAVAVALAILRRARRVAPAGGGALGAELAAPACLLIGVALLLGTPVQPWYALPLAGLAALAARPSWLAVPLAAYPLFFAVIGGVAPDRIAALGSAGYLAAAVVVAGAALRRRCPRREDPGPDGERPDGERPDDAGPGSSRLPGPAQVRGRATRSSP